MKQQLSPISTELKALGTSLFEALASHTRAASGRGITRETYGRGESLAMGIVEEEAKRHGLITAQDAAANLVIELPGADPRAPVIACGSHLDSVPNGGNFDGAAGVIAGLLSMIRVKQTGITPPRTIRLYALRGEESAWFGKCYLGSLALFGMLDASDLERPHRDHGTKLRDAMASCGADVGRLMSGQPLVASETIACYLELHIEQGPVMVSREVPVGIVTGIRGNRRYPDASCIGEAAHSGTVPRWLRRDAVFAVSELIVRLDDQWRRFHEQGKDLVVTVGIMHTDAKHHAMSRVPGEVSFSLEFRSRSSQTLQEFQAVIEHEMEMIERSRNVAFALGGLVETPPARMDSLLVEHLEGLCKAMSISHERLPSGAGHDAVIFSNRDVPTAMIFVRNAYGSHNPDEAMEEQDFFLATDVLSHAMLTIPDVLAQGAKTSKMSSPQQPHRSPAAPWAAISPPLPQQHLRRASEVVAKILLDTGSVMVRPDEPFIFSSGWASPIYVDIKKLISITPVRKMLTDMMIECILENVGLGTFDTIGTGEVAGVPFASMVAERLRLPLVIARKHGPTSQLIGALRTGQKILFVDDLATDGRTKQSFCEILRKAGGQVEHIVVVFKFGIYDEVVRAMAVSNIALTALASLEDVLHVASSSERYFQREELDVVGEYASDPVGWSLRHGGADGTMIR